MSFFGLLAVEGDNKLPLPMPLPLLGYSFGLQATVWLGVLDTLGIVVGELFAVSSLLFEVVCGRLARRWLRHRFGPESNKRSPIWPVVLGVFRLGQDVGD